MLSIRGLITNYWEQADPAPAGFEQPLRHLRSLIERTQQPAQCSAVCRMAPNWHEGGAASNLKRLAFHLALASLEGCALVGRYPRALWPAGLVTGASLRERCTASSRFGTHCYFLPVSTCAIPNGTRVRVIRVNRTRIPDVLARITTTTGLRSELLIMGTLHAWIMRPQTELREAIRVYGAQLGLHEIGARQRHIGMHIRHGDKSSLSNRNGARNLGADAFRVSGASFQAWGRRVGANMGAERVLFMSDDPKVISDMHGSHEQYFTTPAPPNCTPAFAMGMSGGRAAGWQVPVVYSSAAGARGAKGRERRRRPRRRGACGVRIGLRVRASLFGGRRHPALCRHDAPRAMRRLHWHTDLQRRRGDRRADGDVAPPARRDRCAQRPQTARRVRRARLVPRHAPGARAPAAS